MSKNPFEDSNQESLDSNPFEDPTVASALTSDRVYDVPDEGDSLRKYDTLDSRPDLSGRVEELERRERELAQREADIENRAERIRIHGRNNWPPGPFPLIYHDIDEEIPLQHQGTVRSIYRLWLVLATVLILNFVGCLLLTLSGAGFADLGAGIMYVPVIGALSFLLWYRPVYSAFIREMSILYYFFFIFNAFHILFSVYMFLGITATGSAGLLNTIEAFVNGHLAAAIVGVFVTVGWAVQGLGYLWMYKQVWAHAHGEKGFTWNQAQSEIRSHGIKAFLFRGSWGN